MAAIQTENLGKGYRAFLFGDLQQPFALQGLSLEVREGETFGFLARTAPARPRPSSSSSISFSPPPAAPGFLESQSLTPASIAVWVTSPSPSIFTIITPARACSSFMPPCSKSRGKPAARASPAIRDVPYLNSETVTYCSTSPPRGSGPQAVADRHAERHTAPSGRREGRQPRGYTRHVELIGGLLPLSGDRSAQVPFRNT